MKNKVTLENINLPSNIISFYPDKKRIIERQNKIKDNDFTNLTKLMIYLIKQIFKRNINLLKKLQGA